MKILKFREFFENASSSDIPFYLKRSRRRKMGNPSQVSDLRDLKPEKINRVSDF